MNPDAARRMAVYQEGQRAFNSGAPCPYIDWRAKTWKKGRDDAQAHYQQRLQDAARQQTAEAPDVDALRLADDLETPGRVFSCGEVAAELRRQHAEIERLTAALDEARAERSVAYLAFERVSAERDALRADAERYRWLRNTHWSTNPLCVVSDPKNAVKLGHTCPTGEYLDMEIDAARAQQKEQSNG